MAEDVNLDVDLDYLRKTCKTSKQKQDIVDFWQDAIDRRRREIRKLDQMIADFNAEE